MLYLNLIAVIFNGKILETIVSLSGILASHCEGMKGTRFDLWLSYFIHELNFNGDFRLLDEDTRLLPRVSFPSDKFSKELASLPIPYCAPLLNAMWEKPVHDYLESIGASLGTCHGYLGGASRDFLMKTDKETEETKKKIEDIKKETKKMIEEIKKKKNVKNTKKIEKTEKIEDLEGTEIISAECKLWNKAVGTDEIVDIINRISNYRSIINIIVVLKIIDKIDIDCIYPIYRVSSKSDNKGYELVLLKSGKTPKNQKPEKCIIIICLQNTMVGVSEDSINIENLESAFKS